MDLQSYVSFQYNEKSFKIYHDDTVPTILYSSKDFPGVIRAINDLKIDMGKVTGKKADIVKDTLTSGKNIIIIGTIGKCLPIDRLIKNKILDVSKISGKWESFLIQTVDRPFHGVDHALIIAGSDKRGTIFGIYDLAEKIGISPWYWWADVPVEKKKSIYIKPCTVIQSPSVKYRGIFLNDEFPALTNWIMEKYGTVKPKDNPPIPGGVGNYNREFYKKLFELILRLKGNYLWPAMWNNAFNEDDPENPRLADEYGIVMGTSHQEPMLRAQKEWDRRYKETLGYWNYALYPDVMEKFWREGIKRNSNYESIITIGLRGADDTPMAEGGIKENISLLEKIIGVQRKIISDEMKTSAEKVPQMWCLYKEVQDYYNSGMRVPDDVTLLWAEDNWGNIRRLPTSDEAKRSGGAGIYYHFDYHGGPRSYQWINTSPIAKIWDQMSMAKKYGADRIWIVNVGHFKGYEFPIEYFLNLAWDTDIWTNENINEYTRLWAMREFGETYSREIAYLVSKYTKFNGRIKPELLGPSTYSLTNYNESETVVNEYNNLSIQAENIYRNLSESKRDAFYQLVLFPIKSCAVVNELYSAAGKNALYFRQERASTNDMMMKTKKLFQTDIELMDHFNRTLAGGKWNHFMDQAHLGYLNWRDPPENSLQAIDLRQIEIPDLPSMGIAVEGSDKAFTEGETPLQKFDIFNRQTRYIEIFNKGNDPFEFAVTSDKPWIVPGEIRGIVEKDKRIHINIDWNKAPRGISRNEIKISGTGKTVKMKIEISNPKEITPETLKGFVEGDGVLSMSSGHYTKKIDMGNRKWIRIEDYGYDLSGMKADSPPFIKNPVPGKDSPCLEYTAYFFSKGKFDIHLTFGTTLNFMPDRGLQYALSIDAEKPEIITLIPRDYKAQNGNRDWEKSVILNYRISSSTIKISNQGYHTIKIWMVDPGPVLQKITVDLGGLKPSFMGPKESYYR